MLVALANPVSGGGTAAERLRYLREACAEAGRELRVLETAGPGDIVLRAREALEMAPDAIALVGGDGSIGELARAYRDVPEADRRPVIIVPAGRGNSLYKALLSDAPWKEYVRRSLDAYRVRMVDAAEVAETGDVWILGFSLGYFHDTVESARFFKGLRGRTLYAAAGLFSAIRLRPFPVEVSVDGRAVFAGRSVLVGLAGGPFRGGRLLLYPTSDLADGLLDLVVVEDVPSRRFTDILRAATGGEHVELEEVHAFQGREVRISSTEPMRCELDGTIYPYPKSEVTLRCLEGLLPVAFPHWGWEDVPGGREATPASSTTGSSGSGSGTGSSASRADAPS